MNRKFLDAAGVSTLWSRIKATLEEKQNTIDALGLAIDEHTNTIGEHAIKIEALESGTYDDTELRNLIGNNTEAITLLNSDAETTGSIANTATAIAAAKVAEIIAGADTKYDTLKEIADWILNDTTGAADMANDIAALQAQMVGVESTVVAHITTEIEAALKVDGINKYALASELTALAERIKSLEDAGYATETAVAQALTDAKAYADSLADNYDEAGAAEEMLQSAKEYSEGNLVIAKAYSDDIFIAAKNYADSELVKIAALTEEEIDAAIAAVDAEA